MSTAEEASADAAPETPSYSYKPSLIGAPFEARLEPDALAWAAGSHDGRIPYGEIRRLRLSFRPVTMQNQRFIAEIWPTRGPKIVLASCSWKNMVEQERRDQAFASFITELH